MKTFKILIFLIFAGLIFVGCEKDEEPAYYSTLGLISISNDSIYINSDSDERLLVSNLSISKEIEDSDRVAVFYTLVDKPAPQGVDFIIKLEYIQKILIKQVIELTDEVADTIGNDAIAIDGIGISSNYMNLNFNFLAGGKTHYINLVREEGEIKTDTVTVEIRHNKNNDNELEWYNTLVSFDLTLLKNNVADSVVLRVKANDYNYPNYVKYLTYKF